MARAATAARAGARETTTAVSPRTVGQPVAELLGVGHGGGQGDQLHVVGEVDDDLFPHRAAEPVGQVVDLVHDHVAEPVQGRRSRVSMLRSTSVVMTTTGASPLIVVSPVSRPTFAAPYRRTRSEYFWLHSALIGVV